MKNSRFNDNVNIVGSNLKKYRLEKNLSQEQLCNKLSLIGITLYKNDIYRIENNKRTVKDFELWGITQILNITCEDLFHIEYQ